MKYKIIIPKEEPKQPKTFKELFVNTNIEPTTDENGNIQYNFKATKKQERLANDTDSNSWGFEVIKTEEDAKIFVETMENIPEPNDKLKKAFRDFKKQERLEDNTISKERLGRAFKNAKNHLDKGTMARFRASGFLEGILFAFNELEEGKDFIFKDIEYEEIGWFGRKTIKTRKQTYSEFIIEKFESFLKK